MAKVGDKISFELEDQLFDKGIRIVNAQIVRRYPKALGACCEYLAYDCVDLEHPDLCYTISADEKFILDNS